MANEVDTLSTKKTTTNIWPARQRYIMVATIMLLVAVGSVFAWSTARSSIESANLARFNSLVLESERALLHKFESFDHSLLAGVGLFSASNHVSRAEWRNFTNSIEIETRLTGTNGVGFIANVSDSDLPAYLTELKADGLTDFAIKPDGKYPANYIVQFIEPIDANRSAIGLNIAFEKNRRNAAVMATKTGKTTITQRIQLVQDNKKSPGFLLLHPLFTNGTSTDTEQQRLASNIGWIYAPFIGKNFLFDLTQSQGRSLHLDVYDGDQATPDKAIYLGSEPSTGIPNYTVTKTIEVMQQHWTLVWKSTNQFDVISASNFPEIILISGLIFSGSLGVLLILNARSTGQIQKQAQQKTDNAVDTEKNLQAVLDTVVDGIISISAEGLITSFNPSAERIFSYEADEVIGKNIKILMPDPYHSEHDGYLQNYHLTGKKKVIGFGRTVQARRKDGSIFPIDLAVNRMQVGSDICFVGSVRDITIQEEAKRALEASEAVLRQTADQASIGMALISPDGKLIQINKSMCKLFGLDEAELLNKDMQGLIHPDDLEESLANMKELVIGKTNSCETEVRFISKMNSVIWCILSISLVRHDDGTPDYFIHQLMDITERKDMDRMKSEFISIISHELRTPLTSISGSLGLIVGAMSSEVSEKTLNLISIAQKNSERLIALVNDILDIDKLDSGQMQYEIQRLNLAPILEQSVDTNKAYAESFDVILALKPTPSELELNVDPLRLQQVLANLMSNATKFSPGGSKVTISARQIDKSIRIEITDRGMGIPDEFRSRIFSKFAQADSSNTRNKNGTGLGLQITKQLVEHMGGQIGYESIVDEGSTFWIEFPQASSDTQFEAAEHEIEEARSA